MSCRLPCGRCLCGGVRFRNLGDDADAGISAVVAAAVFVTVGALLITVAVVAPRKPEHADRIRAAVRVIAAISAAWWIGRMAAVVVRAFDGEHSVAFVLVHAVLAIGFVVTALIAGEIGRAKSSEDGRAAAGTQ